MWPANASDLSETLSHAQKRLGVNVILSVVDVNVGSVPVSVCAGFHCGNICTRRDDLMLFLQKERNES